MFFFITLDSLNCLKSKYDFYKKKRKKSRELSELLSDNVRCAYWNSVISTEQLPRQSTVITLQDSYNLGEKTINEHEQRTLFQSSQRLSWLNWSLRIQRRDGISKNKAFILHSKASCKKQINQSWRFLALCIKLPRTEKLVHERKQTKTAQHLSWLVTDFIIFGFPLPFSFISDKKIP